MIYQFKCPICGKYKEVVRHHTDCALPEKCDFCGYGMERVYSVPQLSVSSFKGEYNPGLGCHVSSKKDIREAQRRIYNETGHEIVEIGNERVKAKQLHSAYDAPRGVWDSAIQE